MIDTPDAMSLMQELVPKSSGLASECVRREDEKDAVDLKVCLAEDPSVWFLIRYRAAGPILLLTVNGFMD